MKHSVSQSTEAYLETLKNKVEEDVVAYVTGKDDLDRIIIKEKLRISAVFFDHNLGLMLIVLTNSKVIKRRLSDFAPLISSTKEDLHNFVNSGVGVHWPKLDYDLSLKGFLQFELTHSDLSSAA
jgi:hypothetical protein